jgi:hypothetical protein
MSSIVASCSGAASADPVPMLLPAPTCCCRCGGAQQRGPSGPSGPPGPPGPAGMPGQNGHMGAVGVTGLMGMKGRDLTMVETLTTVVLGKAGKDVEFANMPGVLVSDLVRRIADLERYILKQELANVMPCKDTNALIAQSAAQ